MTTEKISQFSVWLGAVEGVKSTNSQLEIQNSLFLALHISGPVPFHPVCKGFAASQIGSSIGGLSLHTVSDNPPLLPSDLGQKN